MPLMNHDELETLQKAVAEVSPALPTYDPNIRWSKHIIEITYQQWDYRLSVEVEIGGNLHGAEVLEYAISTHADDLFKAQGEDAVLVLRRPAADGSGDEDTLEVCADDGDLEDFLTDMCVGLRIVRHEREDRK